MSEQGRPKMNLPFSEACERNKEPILQVLRARLKAGDRVLEIGSGTGQHAVYFSRHLPGVVWQASDLPERCAALGARIAAEGESLAGGGTQPAPPLALTIGLDRIATPYDAVFSANTAHILPVSLLGMLFQTVADGLVEGGLFLLYGPFQHNGQHNSESNRHFDLSLRSQGFGGVPDLCRLDELAAASGLQVRDRVPMPANNRLLVYQRVASVAP